MRSRALRVVAGVTAVAIAAAVLAACSSTGTTTKSSTSTTATGKGNVPQVSATSFTRNFKVMASLKPLVSMGKGKIGVLLPETTTSARYTSFDAPYLKRALNEAGMSTSDFTITNAQGSDATELTQAQSDIAQGASVLIMDPIDSGVGTSIEAYAKSHGVQVIDYDRLTLGGSRAYYVSFNNVEVGKLIGRGLVSCITAWNVSTPQVLVMRGAPTDNNATLFAQGYNGVLAPHFTSGKYVKVGEPAGSWTPPVAQTTFEQQYTAHPNTNAVVTPNDTTANAVISYLKTLNIAPTTFPTTGQDATLIGLQNVLSGYQCGTAYKPIYLEAQAAVSLALYVRASQTPPKSLVNGQTKDTTANVEVPSVLLTPIWVTTGNMNSTVVKDGFVTTSQLCAGSFATACTSAGITP